MHCLLPVWGFISLAIKAFAQCRRMLLDNAVIISRNRQYNNQMISTYLLREGDDAKLVFAMMYILSL